MQRGLPDITEVETLRTQIQNLKANYGSSGASSTGVVIDEMNQQFSGQQIDSLASELLLNIDVALYLIEESEAKRYRFAKVDGLSAFLGSEKSAANKSREHLT